MNNYQESRIADVITRKTTCVSLDSAREIAKEILNDKQVYSLEENGINIEIKSFEDFARINIKYGFFDLCEVVYPPSLFERLLGISLESKLQRIIKKTKKKIKDSEQTKKEIKRACQRVGEAQEKLKPEED